MKTKLNKANTLVFEESEEKEGRKAIVYLVPDRYDIEEVKEKIEKVYKGKWRLINFWVLKFNGGILVLN